MEKVMTNNPILDITGNEISSVGIVVEDVINTAKWYSKIFGVGPWFFFDYTPKHMMLNGRPVEENESCVRTAVAHLGKLEIELLQPLYGPSTIREYLETHGGGVHHFSLGAVENYASVVAYFENHGSVVETQGRLGDGTPFSYIDMQRQLGAVFKIAKPDSKDVSKELKPWGTYSPDEPGLIDLKGDEIVQIGFVVGDIEETAGNYQEILGVGPWEQVDFKPPMASGKILHGVSLVDDMDFHIKAAFAKVGEMELELLEPVFGAGTHVEFLKTRGPGI